MLDPKIYMAFLTIPIKTHLGKPTNGATTGPHLHFSIKKESNYIDPLTLF